MVSASQSAITKATLKHALELIRTTTDGDLKQQGTKFEQLVKYYLLHDPVYKLHFKAVYLWGEWRKRRGESQQDVGIDLVAEHANDDDITAIQAKFYDSTTPISRDDINTFLAASGKHPFTHRLFVTTATKWGGHAIDALRGQTIPCTRISSYDMERSAIDWGPYIDPTVKPTGTTRTPLDHQTKAIKAVTDGLRTADRGKLIMACGTGKTYTALCIAEKMTPKGGHILFLVPSLSLLSQTLHEWSQQCTRVLHNVVVCSDTKVGKENADTEDISVHDLALPATTNPQTLAHGLARVAQYTDKPLTVVYATYHSIDVVATAQQQYGAPVFDVVICDEAHRTTGAEKIDDTGGKKTSYYNKVHDASYLKAAKRLYMTATPRIYSADSKRKAHKHDIEVYSMDDEDTYGTELHRLGFAEAVEKQLLSDYKVMVLCVNEQSAAATMAQMIPEDKSGALTLQDTAKLIGCWNGLAKRFGTADLENIPQHERHPMRRARPHPHHINEAQAPHFILNAIFSTMKLY